MCNSNDTNFCFHEEASFEPAIESFASLAFMPQVDGGMNTSSLLPSSTSAWDQDYNNNGLDKILEQDAVSFEALAAAETLPCTLDDWTMALPLSREHSTVLEPPSSGSNWSVEVDSLLTINQPETHESDNESLLSRTATPSGSKSTEGSVSPRPSAATSSHAESVSSAHASANVKVEKKEEEQPVARGRGGKPRSRKNAKPFYWTSEDHKKFLAGLEKFGLHDSLGPGGAELVAMFMGTRTPLQVRSHAQKYFSELGLAR